MRPLLLLPLAACTSGPYVYELPCDVEALTHAPSEVTHLGFSADEVGTWFGDAVVFDVRWTGWHSQSPPGDVFDVTLGPITGEIMAAKNTPIRQRATAAECAAWDLVTFAREATLASRDGQVSGVGEAWFELGAMDVDRLAFGVSVAPATLSDERWAEVARHLDDDLVPPEQAVVYLRVAPDGASHASVAVEGEHYQVNVWNCEEQHRNAGDCVAMTGLQDL